MKVISIITVTFLLACLCGAQPVPPMPPVPPAAEMQKLIRQIASEVLICTNEKESVTVVTNFVESTNERGCQNCQMQRLHPELNIYHPPHEGGLPYVPATEKYRTITCKEVRILTFTWRGIDRSMMEETVLWQTNQVWMLESQWKEVTPQK